MSDVRMAYPEGHPLLDLSAQQVAHVDELARTRPEWKVMVIKPLYSDETPAGQGAHIYPRVHPYISGMQFALARLRKYSPCYLLDIGSPLAQVVAMALMPGIGVSVVDIRPYPNPKELGVIDWIQANATDIPLPSASQALITSFWALAHVGDGRYGDSLNVNGDLAMLREIHRLLSPQGIALVGIGPMHEQAGALFNLHRVYSWSWLLPKLREIGFEVLEQEEVPVAHDMYLDGSWGDKPRLAAAHAGHSGVYGIVHLRKL